MNQEQEKALRDQLKQNIDKWRYLEKEYILPLFEIAKKDGWDLEKFTKDNPGKNCVILFAEKILRERDELREKELEMRRKAIITLAEKLNINLTAAEKLLNG